MLAPEEVAALLADEVAVGEKLGANLGLSISAEGELRAQLDAWYARVYGLNRHELRYILDPTDVEGRDDPSETFRVLQKNELMARCEYRTQRRALEAWGRLHKGARH